MLPISTMSENLGERLPPSQPLIQTSNVRLFGAYAELLTDPHRRCPVMGSVTGSAGIGKTIAIEHQLASQQPLPHTGLPSRIKVVVKSRSTPKALAFDILAILGEKPRGRNIYEAADEAAAAIIRNDLQLLLIDEADRLNEDSFDLVRSLFDITGCPIVVVGLPAILSVIDRQEKFASRIGLRLKFIPPDIEEVLNVILPNLVFPRWEFNPSDEADCLMGQMIWDMVKPSLRKLRNLLQIASQSAESFGENRITSSMIQEAFRWSATPEDMRHMADLLKVDEIDQLDDLVSQYEKVSEQRNDAKRGRTRHK
jgi:DNA transposition AAA+ family ATPase